MRKVTFSDFSGFIDGTHQIISIAKIIISQIMRSCVRLYPNLRKNKDVILNFGTEKRIHKQLNASCKSDTFDNFCARSRNFLTTELDNHRHSIDNNLPNKWNSTPAN